MDEQVPGLRLGRKAGAGGLRGFYGSVLQVDLARGEIRQEELRPDLARLFVGGRGLVARCLWDEVGRGRRNAVGIATGPFAGPGSPLAGRAVLVGDCPDDGGLGQLVVDGRFAHAFKSARHDLVLIRGRSRRPVYLSLAPGHCSLNDATALRGLSLEETQHRLAEWEPRSRLLCVVDEGAAVDAPEHQVHRCGRADVGRLLYEKNLRGIAVAGWDGAASCSAEHTPAGGPHGAPEELACDDPWRALSDSLAIPGSARLTLGMALRLHRNLTGLEWTAQEMVQAGERIVTLCRLFEIRDGARTNAAGERAARVRYFEARGWDENGVPSPRTLETLGLGDMIPVLEELGAG